MTASAGSPRQGPLAGIRVVEIAGIGPGPYACLLLAELGASVARFERTAALPTTQTPELGRSRDSVTAVDLRSAAGVERVLTAAASADVLVEGMRPGVAERLGIGPQACWDRNARLVYGRMTGWGQTGPLAQQAGHDINYAALSGALHAIGPRDRPRTALNLVADFGGGSMFLVAGILAALIERQTSGRGQIVDASMLDGAASLMTMVYGLHAEGRWVDDRESNLIDGGAPFYNTYECSDGKFIAVGALEPQFFAALIDKLGLAGVAEQYDVATWPKLRADLTAAFATRTRDEWTAWFADAGDACVTPVLTLAEAPLSAQARSRRIFRPVGGGHVPVVAPRFSRSPTADPDDHRRGPEAPTEPIPGCRSHPV